MPTATIQVAAVTSPDDWTLGAGADKVVAVNLPDDADTSYIHGTAEPSVEQYSLEAHSIPVGSTINSVSAVGRVKGHSVADPWFKLGVYLAGNSTLSATITGTASYADYTKALARPGGGAWSVADIAAVEVLIHQVTGLSARFARCTSLYVVVDYTPPTDTGKMFLMFN